VAISQRLEISGGPPSVGGTELVAVAALGPADAGVVRETAVVAVHVHIVHEPLVWRGFRMEVRCTSASRRESKSTGWDPI
jgi:hypothetical protein